jgi:phosphoribosylaminoimidazole-succinocarboxamide synthase
MRQQSSSVLENPMPKNSKSAKRELLFEGRKKNLYISDQPELIYQEFKQPALPEGKRESRSKEVSALRNHISSYLFKYLEGFRIPTHFVSKASDTEMLVRRLEIIPLTIKIYNACVGTLPKRFNMKEGTLLDFPVIEHYDKKNAEQRSWVNESHMYAFGMISPEEFKQLNRIASKINAVLRGLCDRRQLMLAELQLEFGKYKYQIVVADELSPSTCRFWDYAVENKGDRDRFSPEADKVEESYAALRDRLELKV